jgi:hypothetical protein
LFTEPRFTKKLYGVSWMQVGFRVFPRYSIGTRSGVIVVNWLSSTFGEMVVSRTIGRGGRRQTFELAFGRRRRAPSRGLREGVGELRLRLRDPSRPASRRARPCGARR